MRLIGMNPQIMTPDHHLNILELHRQGWSQTAIAKALGFTRRTIYNHIHHRVFTPGKTRGRPKGSRKLAVFKAQIVSQLELRPQISIHALWKELQMQGYAGGLSILRDFCRSQKPKLESPPINPFVATTKSSELGEEPKSRDNQFANSALSEA